MENKYDREWYEDDTPIDLSKYDNWTKEEIDAEITRLEEEGREERDRLRRERVLASVN
jgi:hypothetical protein